MLTVTERAGDAGRVVMQVEDEFCEAARRQPPGCASGERRTVDRHGCLGANVGQWPKAGAEAGGEDQRRWTRHPRVVGNTRSRPLRPNSTACCRKRLR